MGWSELENGYLLEAAQQAGSHDGTGDKNIAYQQNLKGRKIALVLVGTTN